MSSEQNEMKLPEGKTCFDCAHWKLCRDLVGAKLGWTSCDFHPRRYQSKCKECTNTAKSKSVLTPCGTCGIEGVSC